MFRYSPLGLIESVVLSGSLAMCLALAHSAEAFQDSSQKAVSDAAAKTEHPANRLTTPTVPAESATDSALRDKVEQKKSAEALKRRAGEKVGGDPRGEALILGMNLQEGNRGVVKVTEVSAASPAFDAGIREGDVILSYQGFNADSYRKWIDGMNRLTGEAKAGARIPVLVEREGKRMSLAIRVPERPVRPPMNTLAQKINPLPPGVTGPAGQLPSPAGQTPVPVGGGGSDVLIDNSGLGSFFGDQTESANDRAVAHIFRLTGPPPANATAAAGTNNATGVNVDNASATTTGATGGPAGKGTRIGIAGFRDDPSGMVVMLDVGALAPGNYVVGIGESPSGGITQPGAANPNVNTPLQTPAQGQLPAPDAGPRFRLHNPAAPTQQPAQPQPAPAGTPQQQQQGNLQPASELIPRTVLAQVSGGNQTSGSSTAASGSSDAAAPSGAPPGIGQPGLNDARRNLAAQNAAGTNQTNTGSTLNEIGTLRVDQSGTGRLQTTVESAQVRNVVGQSIVIYSMGGTTGNTPQTPVPPNVSAGAQATPRQQVDPVTSAKGEPGLHAEPPAAAGSQAVNAGQGLTVQRVPVASGVIRLLSDRRPPPTGTETTSTATETSTGTATELNPGRQRPATATPGTGQNQLR